MCQFNIYFILFKLELLGDEYKAVSLYLSGQKRIQSGVITFLTKIGELFDRVYKLYTGFSKEKAVENAALYDEITSGLDVFSTKEK